MSMGVPGKEEGEGAKQAPGREEQTLGAPSKCCQDSNAGKAQAAAMWPAHLSALGRGDTQRLEG